MSLNWTNPSVVRFAGAVDPIEAIQRAARALVFNAIEKGWTGPPFDPFDLAAILDLRVIPSQEISDAILTPEGRSFRVDFNPNQSQRRIRFSIAHELAHTLFPDCREQVRNRARREAMRGDEWQLEMLCNIAAGEILMPVGDLSTESQARLTIDDLIDLQEKFNVSMEAVLLRVVRLERHHCAVFVASPFEGGYRLDYAVETHGANFGLQSGLKLPCDTRIADCRAIGYTAKTDEAWTKPDTLHIESIAIPAFPGQFQPRVAGIAYRKGDRGEVTPRIEYIIGDGAKPRGKGPKVIAHVVNDSAARWGGRGFANALRRTWPHVQDDFREWTVQHPHQFSLGSSHPSPADNDVVVFSMIAQHGYGPARLPRIRYNHLRSCLLQLRDFAKSAAATVHMPRIGCGEAGGNWSIVQDLILECLSDYGVAVTIYDLQPQARAKYRDEQQSLFMNS